MAFQRSTDNIDVPNRRDVSWAHAPSGYNAQNDNLGWLSGAAVAAYRIVKFDANGALIQGAAATDTTIGINQSPQGASAAGQQLMIAHLGMGLVELGGTVTRGDLLTTDTVGRAVTSLASPTDRVIGVALASGGTGNIVPVLIVPSKNGGVT